MTASEKRTLYYLFETKLRKRFQYLLESIILFSAGNQTFVPQ